MNVCRVICIALPLLLTSACTSGASSVRVADTPELVKDPALVAEIDALADEPRVETERVGYGGAPSESYARFAAVARKLKPADLLALLRHRSPVVRAYVANDILLLHPADIGALRPLLLDDSVLSFMEGCIVSDMALGEHVVQHLCWRKDATSRKVLDELAGSSHPRAASVRVCRERHGASEY